MSKPRFQHGQLIHVDKERAYELWSQGKCDKDIAGELGVKRHAVYEWRRKNGLKVNPAPRNRKPKQEKTRSQLAQDAYEARQAGMNYGAYKAQQLEKQRRAKESLGRCR